MKTAPHHLLVFVMSLLMTLPCVASNDSTANVLYTIDSTKAQADTLYQQGAYTAAIQAYEAILRQYDVPQVMYNLGNAYYKHKKIPQAILYYERTLRYMPGHKDALTNLHIAQANLTQQIVPQSQMFFLTWLYDLQHSYSVDQWQWIAIIFLSLLLLSIGFYTFSQHIWVRKVSFVTVLVSLCCFVGAIVFALRQQWFWEARAQAIVMTEQMLKATPSTQSKDLSRVSVGHKVTIRDQSIKGWYQIRLSNGKEGWCQRIALERI